MSEFFAMGGHAAFIWPAYGAAAILLSGLLAVSWRGMRRREALVESLRAGRRPELHETMERAS